MDETGVVRVGRLGDQRGRAGAGKNGHYQKQQGMKKARHTNPFNADGIQYSFK